MKKIFAYFAVFAALIFVVSCGGGSSKTGDTTDTGGAATDDDTADSGSTENPDSDNPDTTPDNQDSDNPDTAPDNGDSTPGNDADSGDSASDSDPSEPANENPDNLPECSPTSATPCFDPETGLIWSGKAPERIRWIDAVDYCKNLKEGGYNDWRLPSVAVLRTLAKECESSGYSDGECSKFGDIVFLWSSNQGNGVFFYDGKTQSKNVDENFDARCVRRDYETRQVTCTGRPEHAEWNSTSNITQTWDWDSASWTPSQTESYSENSTTAECRFKCEENYFWDDSSECKNPCNLNPCGEDGSATCRSMSTFAFSCDCQSGYWWGNGKGCQANRPTLGNICTGQNKCYDNSSEISCPTSSTADFFGQDAWYASLGKCTHQSFTVQTISSDTVVVDNNTGLMWQQTIPTDRYKWNNAVSYCNDSGYAGYNDWRLPTPQELLTIVDNSRYNPAIDTTYFPNTPSTSYFWSSSTFVYNTNFAWIVYFNYGFVYYDDKSNGSNVRCVR